MIGGGTLTSTKLGSVLNYAFPTILLSGTLTTTSTAHFNGDIVRVGINYKFGPGATEPANLNTPMPVKALPMKAPPAAMPLPVAYNWTGFYVGAQAGYSWSNTTVDSSGSAVGTSTIGDPFGLVAPTAAASAAAVAQSIKADPHGFIGGGEIGYNWQFAPQWVAGIEADISGAGIKGSDTKSGASLAGGFPFTQLVTASVAAQEKVDWLGTVRGRLGFTPLDRFLVYGTGVWPTGTSMHQRRLAKTLTRPYSVLSQQQPRLPRILRHEPAGLQASVLSTA